MEAGTKYTEGQYLSGFICPKCERVDYLYYEDCPCCLEKFIECDGCGYKSSQEKCEAVYGQE